MFFTSLPLSLSSNLCLSFDLGPVLTRKKGCKLRKLMRNEKQEIFFLVKKRSRLVLEVIPTSYPLPYPELEAELSG